MRPTTMSNAKPGTARARTALMLATGLALSGCQGAALPSGTASPTASPPASASPTPASTTPTSLGEARERWAESAGAEPTYTMTLRVAIFGPAFGSYRIRVAAGEPASMRAGTTGLDVPTGTDVLEERWVGWVPKSVEELFDAIEEAEAEADEVKVSYDALGYPTEISIDRIAEAVDDEVGYRVPALGLE